MSDNTTGALMAAIILLHDRENPEAERLFSEAMNRLPVDSPARTLYERLIGTID